MARCPELPFLPGFSFNPMLGQTKFNRDPQFDFIEGVPALVEKVKPNMFGSLSDRYPSIFARGEVAELPAWIAFDKQILRFDAYFKETLQEVRNSPFQMRKVKILFFLEDGTIQVIEPKVENSGIPQGTMIARGRIRFPAPMDANFYDIIDFNVGREVEFYAKVLKITDCDNFTRTFLNRLGIAVPDPLTSPADPYLTERARAGDTLLPKKPSPKVDTLGKFLANDRKVLRFYAYWDDQNTQYGYIHNLQLHFYLADDTVDIKEVSVDSSGKDNGFMFIKRMKLPKLFTSLPGPGETANYTLLNVLGANCQTGRYIGDSLNCGKQNVEYYQENDFAIGSVINVYGRRVVITECDPYTKEYYRVKYGIDDFTPVSVPGGTQDECQVQKSAKRQLPPWNGYGSYEDSAQNCVTVEPKAPHKDFKKFLKYDKVGLDTHILRFEARMLSKINENCDRVFVISYFLSDNTIGVFELARRNSGFASSQFLARSAIQLPGQEMFRSEPPECYLPQHMYVGATVIINAFTFILIDADEYALRFMEINDHEYPKSNLKLIMSKVREVLRPIYKDFVAENLPTETPAITYEKLRQKLCRIMPTDFTEQEMVTIARAFSANCAQEKFNRETIRAIILSELKRYLWDDLERLKEYLLVRDAARCGIITKIDCYTVLKACRLPLDSANLDRMINVIKKDQNGNVYYEDLLLFLDRAKCPMADVVPFNIKSDRFWETQMDVRPGSLIDWYTFNKYLDLESTFKEEQIK